MHGKHYILSVWRPRLLMLFLLTAGFVVAQGKSENFSEDIQRAMEKSRAYQAEQQYASAFAILAKADPKNQSWDVFREKYYLAMENHVSVVEWKLFGMKNFKLSDSGDTLDISRKNQDVVVFDFPIYEILDTILSRDSTNIEVHKTMVDYYYLVWNKTKGNWLLPESQLLDKLQFHYQYLIKTGQKDPLYNYMNGYVFFLDGEMDSAIAHLQRAIKIQPGYGDAYYTMGVAYYYLRNYEKSLYYGENATRYLKDKVARANAYRLLGLGFWQKKDYKSAYLAYIESDKLDRKNQATLKLLLESLLVLEHDERLIRINEYFNTAPQDPRIYQNLNEIYISHQKIPELLEFYNLRFESHTGDHQVLGNLHFYKGKLLAFQDGVQALQSFTEANKHFSEIYEDNHPVFAAIQKSIRRVKL